MFEEYALINPPSAPVLFDITPFEMVKFVFFANITPPKEFE